MIQSLLRQRLPASAIRIVDPARETRLALGFSLAYVLAAALTACVVRSWPLPLWGATYLTSDATYALGFKVGLLFILPAVLIHRAGYRLEDLTLGWRATPRTLLSLAVALALASVLNASHLGPIRAAFATMPLAEAIARVSLGAVLALVAAAIPEELVYRWGVQTRFERSWGRLAAIVLTAVFFVAWHLPTRLLLASGAEGTAFDPISVLLGTGVPVFVVGLLFGIAWDRWRNLPVLIAVHWGIDLLPSIASFLMIPPTVR